MRDTQWGAWNVRPQKSDLMWAKGKLVRTQEDNSAEGQSGLQKWGEELSTNWLVVSEADTKGRQGLPRRGQPTSLGTFRLPSEVGECRHAQQAGRTTPGTSKGQRVFWLNF